MNNFIGANLTKPSNDKLAKFLHMSESGVRKRINEQPEVFAENLREYRMSYNEIVLAALKHKYGNEILLTLKAIDWENN